jgi:PKD repeat protein
VNFDYLDIRSGTPPYISYNWDFGDGTTGTGFPVSHNYTSKGPYTVTLSGRDSKGYSFSRTLSNYVSPQQSNTAPVAAGSFSVSGYTATLTDLSYDPDYNQCDHTGSGTIYIDWGDYTNETFTINLTNAPSNRTFSHTYSTANAGTHRVSQQIKDNAGAAASVTTNVTVPSTTTVSGRVTKNGAGVSGVYINFYNQGTTTPLIKRVLTDANGYWPATTINEGQCYTLKPYKYGITFTPASQDVCGFNDQVNFIAN